MKQLLNNTIWATLSISTLVLLLMPTLYATANTSTYIESESRVYSNIEVSSSGNSKVEVHSNTVIDGVESTYYFATTSPGEIKHQVIIENGTVVTDGTNVPASNISNQTLQIEQNLNQKNISVTTTVAKKLSESEVKWFWNVLNYLYFYVKDIF